MIYANSIAHDDNAKKESLLKEISIIDFAVVDLCEYLDTHPDDTDAVMYVKQYISILRKLKEEYASSYGPLTHEDAAFCKNADWRYAKTPMPWEGGK